MKIDSEQKFLWGQMLRWASNWVQGILELTVDNPIPPDLKVRKKQIDLYTIT